MPKINREEYEILKELDGKWRWIARDAHSAVVDIFQVKPYKVGTIWMWEGYTCIDDIEDTKLFQFIQWEDEEPYNIQELIDEYLDDEYGYFNMKLSREFEEFIKKESEETEVKNIEWFVGQMRSMTRLRDPDSERESWYISEGALLEALNQLDEPEVKQLYEKISELESYNDELIRDNNQLRNEIDNQEVLSQEWISENVEYAYFDMLDGSGRLSSATAIIKPKKLQSRLVPKQEITFEQAYDKLREESILSEKSFDYYWNCINDNVEIDEPWSLLVPKQDEEEVPQFVADCIESAGSNRESNKDYVIRSIIDQYYEGNFEPIVYDWFGEKGNLLKFYRAVDNGYTVDEGQKCYALVKGHEIMDKSAIKFWNYSLSGSRLVVSSIGETREYGTQLTKDEWNEMGVNDGNADFVKVEELEE